MVAELYRPRFDPAGQAWETWEYVFRFPSGHTLLAQFQVTNAGLGSLRGVVVGIIMAPDGRTTLIKNGRPRDRWTYEGQGSTAVFRIAKHVLTIAPPVHRLHVQNSQGLFTVEATATTSALRPGRVTFEDGKFHELVVLAPRLKARGTAQFPGGPVIDLGEGTGVALRSYSNTADYKQAGSQFRFHTFDKDPQFSFVELTATEKIGGQRLGYLWVTRGADILAQSFDADRRFTTTRADPKSPHYPVAEGFVLADRGAAHAVTGEARLSLVRRDDLLDWLDSSVARLVVRQFSHPVQYLFDADYHLTLDWGGQRETVAGRGFAASAVLSTPPRDRPF